MAEALSRFESMPDETPSRKMRVRAAVATIGRLLRKPPAELSTQPTYLKQWFRHFKHRPTGLTSKSLANCKTEIRYLVRKVCSRGRKSGFRPLAPEWVQLCEPIAEKPIRWTCLRRSRSGRGPVCARRSGPRSCATCATPPPTGSLRRRRWNLGSIAFTLPTLGRRVAIVQVDPEDLDSAYAELGDRYAAGRRQDV